MSEEQTNDWLDSLPEPLREAPFIGKAESLDDAVSKLAHAAKLVGTSVRIPGVEDPQEDKEAFYAKLAEIEGVTRLPLMDDEEGLNKLLSKLGKPEDVAGYQLPEVADFEWDSKIGDDLRAYALEAGLTATQFKNFAAKIAQQELDASQSTQTSLEEARKALRVDWGDTLEERESLIRGWMDKSGAPESLRTLLDDRSLDIETMNWLHNTAKQFKGEVNPISKDGPSATPRIDPAEARQRIAQTLQDLTNMAPTDPRYKDLNNKLIEYHRLANSGQAA